ncbi:TetR/AcrR family transcriptional regulator [Devosia crocina]|nr:TetR/AcrR family transcriptional regulator [Devosia crocina]
MTNVRSARTGEIRDRIWAAADAEFAENGYEGATMTAIARRAGIALRTLYNYAPRKDLLYFRDLRLFDDLLKIVSETPRAEEVGERIRDYLITHQGRDRAIVERAPKAYESLLWSQLEEQMTTLLRLRYPEAAPSIIPRTEAAMLVLMARSLYWREFSTAERSGPGVSAQWLDLTASIAADTMKKLGARRKGG